MPSQRIGAAAAGLFVTFLASAGARAQDSASASEIAHELQRTTVLGSALYVAAHPDDENTALLAWLANERHYRTAYLSVTRGDGGQNLIGSEIGPLLGMIRTQELLAARRIDHAQQMFTRAIDFGYSKGPDETLKIWNHEKVLGDVVWAMRRFRPDVVITRFPKTGEGGHGHHTSSAILAEEAFGIAADPSKYPEQLAHVKPWQPKRIVWNSWRPQQEPRALAKGEIAVDLGSYNSLLGRSYTEIAGESRSQHKSQGFGAPERRGTRLDAFAPIAGEPAKDDLFDGVDTTWARVPGCEAAATALKEAQGAFRMDDPSACVPALLRARKALIQKAGSDPWVDDKAREIGELVRRASGLWVEAMASTFEAAPGDEIEVTVSAVGRSSAHMMLLPSAAPWASSGGSAPPVPSAEAVLAPNQPFSAKIKIVVPKDAPLTQPHWLAEEHEAGRYAVADPLLAHEPDVPPALQIPLCVAFDGERIVYNLPVKYRWVDPVKGERLRPFVVAPRVTLQLDRDNYVFADDKAHAVTVAVLAHSDKAAGDARLAVPEGWTVEPKSAPFSLAKAGDEAKVQFQVTAAKNTGGSSRERIAAEAVIGGETLGRRQVRIEYDHIPVQTWFPPAASSGLRLDLAHRGDRVGYVTGAGDDVPEAIEQMGFNVTFLTDDDLEHADLGRFDTIVLGVRAYNTRKRLRVLQPRLMEYVERGGTLVAQYNTLSQLPPIDLAPGPMKVTNSRVTDENAAVTMTIPEHFVLREPNIITARDFDGWVQERGLYFVGGVDKTKFDAPLSMADPGESQNGGGLVVGRHGKGIYIYASLAFFRQLPAGVPGAYRLFANLVSARAPHH